MASPKRMPGACGRHKALLEVLVTSADVGVDDPRGQGEQELPPAQGRNRLDSLGVEEGEERAALGAPLVEQLVLRHARGVRQEGNPDYGRDHVAELEAIVSMMCMEDGGASVGYGS